MYFPRTRRRPGGWALADSRVSGGEGYGSDVSEDAPRFNVMKEHEQLFRDVVYWNKS